MGIRSMTTAIVALAVIVLTPALATNANSATFSKNFVGMPTSHLSNCIVDGKDLCQPDTMMVVHRTNMSDGAFCTLLTGTWCEGIIVPPKADTRTMFDPTRFEQHP